MIPNEPNDIATLFFADGHNIATDNIKPQFTVDDVFNAMSIQYNAIDQLIDSFVVRCEQSNTKVDCKKGCEYCCHQPVFATIHEILLVVNYIKTNFTHPQIEKIKAKALIKKNKSKSSHTSDLLKISHPCPLLLHGTCSVYAARPMACRIYLSSDVKSCINRYEQKGDTTNFPALFDFLLTAGRNMNEGFASRLAELNLQIYEGRFEVLLHQLLSDHQLKDKWLKGKTIVN